MGSQTLFDKYVFYHMRNAWFKIRLKLMVSLLTEYGMDWGAYPLEEICKMYSSHKDEINLV